MEETKNIEIKREYESPELTEYGSIEDLTQAGGRGGTDAETFSSLDNV